MPFNKPNNPYASAAGAYGSNAQKLGTSQRDLEAQVLLKAARLMQELQEAWDQSEEEALNDTLKYNRQIWMLFYDTAMKSKEEGRNSPLRDNIINLSNFIFKREIEIISAPDKNKLDVLININKEIAAGLMQNQQKAN
jgi:flagellar protein FlaF